MAYVVVLATAITGIILSALATDRRRAVLALVIGVAVVAVGAVRLQYAQQRSSWQEHNARALEVISQGNVVQRRHESGQEVVRVAAPDGERELRLSVFQYRPLAHGEGLSLAMWLGVEALVAGLAFASGRAAFAKRPGR